MTIEEAISWLQGYMVGTFQPPNRNFDQATHLGIEALERIAEGRNIPDYIPTKYAVEFFQKLIALLPSEGEATSQKGHSEQKGDEQ